ncbi:MAG: GTPase HflX [Bauldia sp.]|nr:GTPase HflX [Bauldia sp.]
MAANEDFPIEPAGDEPAGVSARALVIVPIVRSRSAAGEGGSDRLAAARVEEAAGLARAIDLDVAETMTVPISTYRPATLFGSGKVQEIAERVTAERIGLVIVDHALTPVQQRNLEKAWKTKVIDRTGLILEIFGERAQTREGTLQVELAHLTYQRSRLVRSWTHLERQRGGFGFLGGPGETQIEADRRVISERIDKIKKELQTVVTRRRLQRRSRKRSGQVVVALVGYTNAGKSTLFNALTRSRVFADNRLFATLDPTLRRVELPNGTSVILSDTVGFVSDLPTTLVAAFRATLEEVAEADLILHVRDIAHPDTEAQAADVAAVLSELDIDIAAPGRVIEVWNKVDLLAPRDRPPRVVPARTTGKDGGSPMVVSVSALTGEGLPELLGVIEDRIAEDHTVYRVELAGERLADLHRLYELGEVLARDDTGDGTVIVRARIPRENVSRFAKTFPGAEAEQGPAQAPAA